MRIGIDARVLQTRLLYRGIGVYTYNIIKNLLRLHPNEEYVFYIFEDAPYPDILKSYKKIALKRYPRYNWLCQQFIQFKAHLDVFHFTLALGPSVEIIVPIFQPYPTVATVFDLLPLHLNDTWSLGLVRSKSFRLQRCAIRKVKRIITISNWSKSDIGSKLRIASERIKVIYPGVDRDVFSQSDIDQSAIQKKTDKFILTVGEFTNKNLETTLRSYIKIREMGLKLVVVGSKENCSNNVLQILKNSNLNNDVIFTGTIPDSELVSLYRRAVLLLFPSLGEGFGLPPVEAMNCGCPVIASNRTAIPEVVGGAGILVNPEDIVEVTKSVINLISDNKLREKLIIEGLKRAENFSWEKAAEATYRTYFDVV